MVENCRLAGPPAFGRVGAPQGPGALRARSVDGTAPILAHLRRRNLAVPDARRCGLRIVTDAAARDECVEATSATVMKSSDSEITQRGPLGIGVGASSTAPTLAAV